MKKFFILATVISFAAIWVGCSKDESKNGSVTFGANYDVINCMTTVTIFIDGNKIGKLESPIHEITNCGQPENITKEIPAGEHSYKVEIRPLEGSGCTKDLSGTVLIKENECTKVFIDYFKINF